jgi:lipopolysaccharide transport system permease protein
MTRSEESSMPISDNHAPFSEAIGHRFDTLRALVSREFRMRYKGSFLGIIWAILSPLGTVLTLQFVFTRILPFGTPHFAVFLYSAMLPWVWFQSAIQASAGTLGDNRDLVRTPFFFKPMLPAVVTCTNFLLYLFALPVLLGLMASDEIAFTPALAALPILWIVQGILTLAFTVFISAIGVLVRDVQHLMGVVMMLWFYVTPIFYDLKQVPPDLARWFSLNPMAAIVSAHRGIVLYGDFPNWTELAALAIVSIAILGVSVAIFRQLEDAFIDEA